MRIQRTGSPDLCTEILVASFTQDVLRVWARNLNLRLCGPVQKRVAEPVDTIHALFERRHP